MTTLCLYQNYEQLQLLLKVGDRVFSKDILFTTQTLTSTLSSKLISEIQELCRISDTKMSRLNKIACVNGPSSFTGLRITLATLQGIAFINHSKVFACSTLRLEAFVTKKRTIVLSNNKVGAFLQSFTFTKLQVPEPMTPVQMQENVTCDNLLGNAHSLLKLAELEDKWSDYHALQPFYGHTPIFKKKHNFL